MSAAIHTNTNDGGGVILKRRRFLKYHSSQQDGLIKQAVFFFCLHGMPPTNLSHRHLPSTTSTTSSSSSSSSNRPALPHVLTNSPSNAVHLSRSTARTSRRVRSHWFTHFALNWRRSSRYSKFVFAYSLVLLTLQVK